MGNETSSNKHANREPDSAHSPNPSPLSPLVVVSGPSGVGKTTVVEGVLRLGTLPLRRAITATTRARRPEEVAEESYHYWTREQFDAAIKAGEMFEWAEVFGLDLYGTPRSEVDQYREKGIGVILVIDVQGAARVRQENPDCLLVFIEPPSFEELERRLRGRKDMSEDRIRRRLETARAELAQKDKFDFKITNDDLHRAVAELEQLIRPRFPTRGESCSTS